MDKEVSTVESRKPLDKGTMWGLILIVFGGLLLLQTFGIFRFVWDAFWGLAFMAGAAAFGVVFINDRRQWWALFPAAFLGYIGLIIELNAFVPWFHFGGSLFLAAIGLAFIAVYINRRDQVWPLIPGGALLTLATVAGIDEAGRLLRWVDDGAVFFWGLAATFAVVYVLAPNRRAYSWSLIVAAGCFGIGMLAAGGLVMKLVLPIALIAVGAYMLRDRFNSHNS